MFNMKRLLKRITAVISAVTLLCFVSDFSPTDSSAVDISQEQINTLTKQIAVLINNARTERGLQPLYVVPYLCEVSKIRSDEITFKFSHNRPTPEETASHSDNGSSNIAFSTVLDRDITEHYTAAENIAAGKPTAVETFLQWQNSPPHWGTITNPVYTHLGVAVTYSKESRYKLYWETIFIATDKVFDDQYLPAEYDIIPKSCGDINGDARVDTFDYAVLADYIDKKREGKAAYLNELQLEAADCFKDGSITPADAKALQRYVLGEYKVLPYVF